MITPFQRTLRALAEYFNVAFLVVGILTSWGLHDVTLVICVVVAELLYLLWIPQTTWYQGILDKRSKKANTKRVLATPSTGPSPEGKMPLDLFISHSSQDKEIATALVALLRQACTISEDQIRCTSVDGYKLEPGVDVIDTLRKEVLGSTIFIGLLTDKSISSTFVLFELGARWGAGLRLIPLLACGLKPANLRTPLTAFHSVDCANASELHDMITNICTVLNKRPARPGTYQSYLDRVTDLSQKQT